MSGPPPPPPPPWKPPRPLGAPPPRPPLNPPPAPPSSPRILLATLMRGPSWTKACFQSNRTRNRVSRTPSEGRVVVRHVGGVGTNGVSSVEIDSRVAEVGGSEGLEESLSDGGSLRKGDSIRESKEPVSSSSDGSEPFRGIVSKKDVDLEIATVARGDVSLGEGSGERGFGLREGAEKREGRKKKELRIQLSRFLVSSSASPSKPQRTAKLTAMIAVRATSWT